MLQTFWKKFQVPILAFLVCLFAFGLQALWLGYYVDDWGILDSYATKGIEGLRQYAFMGNRTLVFWTWWLGFQVNGFTPALWQVWTLFWRFLTVVAFWLALREIWPGHKKQVIAAALLFAVYPIYLQQSTALTYSFHWICFFLYFISLYFMVLAIRRPGRFWLFTGLSLLAGAVELFSQEFYVGLELLRPFVIGYLLWGSIPGWKQRLRQVVVRWLPYLIVFTAYLAWRFFLMPTSGRDRNTPAVILGIFQSPLSTIPKLLQTAVMDTFNGVVAAWFKTMQPAQLFSISPVSSALATGLVILTFGGLFFILIRSLRVRETVDPASNLAWYRSGFILGVAAMLLGFAPGWSTGQSITVSTGMYNDRFGLAAMAGAALVVVSLIDWIIQNHKYQLALYCLLIGLAVGFQFRNATNYRWSWEKQLRTYWELKWRAPQIDPPTTFFAESTLFSYMGGGANAAAFKQMYSFQQDSPDARYEYNDLYKVDPDDYLSGGAYYSSAYDHNLVIQSYPESGECVWVLSSADYYNPYLSSTVKAILPVSNLNIIHDDTTSLPASIFGAEPAPFWCYYYEKAGLAAQFGQWDRVMSLWKEAQGKGFTPSIETEYLPFIEAAGMTGDWQLARDLGKKADHPTYQMNDYICTVWSRVFQKAPPSDGRTFTQEWAKGEFDCSKFIK